MLHTIELLLKLELVQLLLRLVQLLLAWLCWEIGATYSLLPKLVELPLRLTEILGAIEIIKLFALVEFVELFLLGRWRALFSELVSRRPAGGRSQKKRRQQQTYSHEPEQFHRRTSVALWTPSTTISKQQIEMPLCLRGRLTRNSPFNRHHEANIPLPVIVAHPAHQTRVGLCPGIQLAYRPDSL